MKDRDEQELPRRCHDGDAVFNPHELIERRRRRVVIDMFCLIGALFLLAFGINSLFEAYTGLAYVLIGSGLALAGSWFVARASGESDHATLPVSAVILLLFFVLLITGGVENTGILWCFAFTPLLQYIVGGVRGSVLVALVTVATALILFLPGSPLLMTDNSMVVKTRFFAAFLAVTMMAQIYEYSRHYSFEQLASVSRRMYEDSRTDPLTGLTNRRAMEEILELESFRAGRSGHPFSVMLADLDRFKTINDSFGHEAGDEVLRETARRLQDNLRQQDMVARWGGEEFLVLLPDTDAVAAQLVAEKLRRVIADKPAESGSQLVPLTMSLGVETVRFPEPLEDFLRRADQNLYRAKHEGRNRVVASDITPAGRDRPARDQLHSSPHAPDPSTRSCDC